MRLLVLADASSVHAARWTEWFDHRGHQVVLASLEPPRNIGVPFRPLAMRARSRWYEYLAAMPGIIRLIQEFRPQMVNAHFVPNYGLMGALSGFHPLAISSWGSDLLLSPRKSVLHRARIKLALGRADVITCDGQVLAQEICKMGIRWDIIHNIPLGIDRNLIASSRMPRDNRGPVLISTRSLEPIYDVDTLIRAMPLIANQILGARLLVVGGGSQENRLKKLAADLGVGSLIVFMGRLNHHRIFSALDKADIYISCSRSDSTSVSLLEAMARGLIPVVSDIPGNREWIRDGENGYLFQPGDHEHLSEIVNQVFRRRHDWKRIIALNKELVIARACWQSNMDRVEHIFLKAIESR